jgi:DNA-binding NarL/FixJ family response regulator
MERTNFLKRRVVVIDKAETAEGIAFILNNSEKFMAVATYQNAGDALPKVRVDRPEIILMELELPDMNGTDALKEIRTKFPSVDVIILSNYDDHTAFIEAFSNGASGYLIKTQSGIAKIDQYLENLLRGGVPLSDIVAKKLVESFRRNIFTPLTFRETQILKLISEGNSYSEIATTLEISGETSKTHIKNIYKKLMVNSRSQAVKKALTEKLI